MKSENSTIKGITDTFCKSFIQCTNTHTSVLRRNIYKAPSKRISSSTTGTKCFRQNY